MTCPGCGHPDIDHGDDGCLHDWQWDPDGIATIAGCDCRWRPAQ